MSRSNGSDTKARFLRALAFEIHRKQPAVEALTDCIEKEGRGGRHRAWRPAMAVLESDGFVAALLAAELLGEEAGALLSAVMEAKDHRLLSTVLNNLADYHERQDD